MPEQEPLHLPLSPEESGAIRLLLEDASAVDALTHTLSQRGWIVEAAPLPGGLWSLSIRSTPAPPTPIPGGDEPGCVVVLDSEAMGLGDLTLGRLLLSRFVRSLPRLAPPPQTLVLYNTGVRLACEGSPVLSALRALLRRGSDILVCETSLMHLGLTHRLALGTPADMDRLTQALCSAHRVVRP